jgi:hypothetical protein
MSLVKIWMMRNFGGCGGEMMVVVMKMMGDEDDEWRMLEQSGSDMNL